MKVFHSLLDMAIKDLPTAQFKTLQLLESMHLTLSMSLTLSMHLILPMNLTLPMHLTLSTLHLETTLSTPMKAAL